MKKFLSLVMALVMTMSLVTIGAGATEYKDLSDKGEIQYEEAVAVLNKLGIITGYEDGSFKPTGALTRGAAAKIIVSMMIGPEAANKLSVTAAPYKDVPTSNTFAGVISYCKTAGYINGYADGTFRPTGALTGYAFAKMLLGAVGYEGKYEGFTGSGWTMNVAKLGSKAGLYNDFATTFKGNDGLTRQDACLLALNTLKATNVQYAGNAGSIVVGDTTVNLGTPKYEYVTSNNLKINKNINATTEGNGANYFTLEFGEEHFPDLKLVQTVAVDDYGRPSNEWNFKNVTIGTYAQTADYTFTESASGDTAVDKVKSMGLGDYTFAASVPSGFAGSKLTINGREYVITDVLAIGATPVSRTFTAGSIKLSDNAEILKAFTQNGSKVQVYLSDTTANLITHIAVTQTQVMQINRVTSADVTLKTVEGEGISLNTAAVAVNAVKNDSSLYNSLKDLKADDYVVITPLTGNQGASYDVDGVFVPTTATGNITKVNVNAAGNNTSAVTIGGTEYKMSKNWTADGANSNPFSILNQNSVSTRLQSTVYMDAFGYVIFAKDVTAVSAYFMYDEAYSTVVDGRIHYFAQGWDAKGNEVSLDFGTSYSSVSSLAAGKVYFYELATSNSNGDYQIDTIASNNSSGRVIYHTGPVAANDITINSVALDSGVKFVFPTLSAGTTGELTGVTVKDGAQKVASSTFQYVLNKDKNRVVAVFMANDTDVEVSTNVLYVQKQTAVTTDKAGNKVSVFTGFINGEKKTDLVANKVIADDSFYTYKVDDASGIYTVNKYTSPTDKVTSVLSGAQFNKADLKANSNAYLNINQLKTASGVALGNNLNLANAVVVDLRTGGTLSSAKDMAEATSTDTISYTVSLVYNDAINASTRGRVAYVFITGSSALPMGAPTSRYEIPAMAGYEFSTDANPSWSTTLKATVGERVYVRSTTSALFAAVSGTVTNANGAITVAVAGADTYSSFIMTAGNITSNTLTSDIITSARYDAAANKIYMTTGITFTNDYTLAKNKAFFSVVKKLLEDAGVTGLTFSGTDATSASVTGSKDGFAYTMANADILKGTSFVNIKVGGTPITIASGTMLNHASVGVTGNAKVVSAGITKAVASTALASTTVVDGAEYTSNIYTAFTYTAQTGLTATGASTDGVYSTAASGGVTDVTNTANTLYLAAGENLTITITSTAALTAGADTFTTASTTGTTVTASTSTVVYSFAANASPIGTTKTFTYTAPAASTTIAAVAALVAPVNA